MCLFGPWLRHLLQCHQCEFSTFYFSVWYNVTGSVTFLYCEDHFQAKGKEGTKQSLCRLAVVHQVCKKKNRLLQVCRAAHTRLARSLPGALGMFLMLFVFAFFFILFCTFCDENLDSFCSQAAL